MVGLGFGKSQRAALALRCRRKGVITAQAYPLTADTIRRGSAFAKPVDVIVSDTVSTVTLVVDTGMR